MASIELPLPHDPADYEPKAVAGKFSYRAFATIIAVIASEIPLIMRLISLGMDELPNTNVIVILAALPAALIALIGLSKREGLYFEQWFPSLVQELMTPTTITPVEVLPARGRAATVTKADAHAARAEEGVLASMAASVTCLCLSDHRVLGRTVGDERPSTVVTALAPALLVRHELTACGIRPRQARRLARRGVTLVPADMGGVDEVRSHKWVSRRLARRACRAACELSALVGPYDLSGVEDALAVLAAYGVDAKPEEVALGEEFTAAEEKTHAEPEGHSSTADQPETDALTPSSDSSSDEAPVPEAEHEVLVPVEFDMEVPSAPQTVAVTELRDGLDGTPPLSKRAARALTKAGIEEVALDGDLGAASLMERYGICRKAAEELSSALETLAANKERCE